MERRTVKLSDSPRHVFVEEEFMERARQQAGAKVGAP
jgi:hypothetical protein